jgi:hypothetical protein
MDKELKQVNACYSQAREEWNMETDRIARQLLAIVESISQQEELAELGEVDESEYKVAARRIASTIGFCRKITAGVIRDPKRIKDEMDKRGIMLAPDWSVSFMPLSENGVPLVNAKATRLSDVSAAERQTKHVRVGLEDKLASYSDMQENLTSLARMVSKVATNDMSGCIAFYQKEIEPFTPGRASRAPIMVAMLRAFEELSNSLEKANVIQAERGIRGINKLIDEAMDTWKKQLVTWAERRQLILSLQGYIYKDNDGARALMTASHVTRGIVTGSTESTYRAADEEGEDMDRYKVASQLVRLAKQIMAEDEEDALEFEASRSRYAKPRKKKNPTMKELEQRDDVEDPEALAGWLRWYRK